MVKQLLKATAAKNITFVLCFRESFVVDLNQKIQPYLTEKNNIVRQIFLTAAFALLFINLYAPFNVVASLQISKLELLLYSSGIILTGVLVVAISRIIMYQKVRRGMELMIYQYLLWIAAEIVSMALFYTFFELVILNDRRSFTDVLGVSVLNTSLTLLIPYAGSWLYFSWRDKKKKLLELTEFPDTTAQKTMIPLHDEKGVLRLSLKRADLLYFQGSDNYVTAYYLSHDRLSKFLLRNTLKKMEDELITESVIRCHRSYLVNMDRVKLIRREKDGLILELDTTASVTIPVSKTYASQVLMAFGQEK